MAAEELDDAEIPCNVAMDRFYIMKPNPAYPTHPFFLGCVKKRGKCPESGAKIVWVQYWELKDGETDFYTGSYHPNAFHPNGCRYVVGSFSVEMTILLEHTHVRFSNLEKVEKIFFQHEVRMVGKTTKTIHAHDLKYPRFYAQR